jgi:hypothetical protein
MPWILGKRGGHSMVYTVTSALFVALRGYCWGWYWEHGPVVCSLSLWCSRGFLQGRVVSVANR